MSPFPQLWSRAGCKSLELKNHPSKETANASSIYPYRSHIYFTHDLIDVRARKVGFYAREGLFPSQKRRRKYWWFYIGNADGQLKMPPQWIGTSVVKLKRS
jgi:hypothetical protein